MICPDQAANGYVSFQFGILLHEVKVVLMFSQNFVLRELGRVRNGHVLWHSMWINYGYKRGPYRECKWPKNEYLLNENKHVGL